MSWIQKLYETSREVDKLPLSRAEKPWPVSHVAKRAHVEVSIDGDGNFRGVRSLGHDEAMTIIPVTESSSNRTSNDEPHPLCEELSYCAADLPSTNKQRFNSMIRLLEDWANSRYSHPKVRAVRAYLQKGELYNDLSKSSILPFKIVNPNGRKTPVDDRKLFVRWRIEESGNPCSGTWEDETLIDAWIDFDAAQNRPPEKSRPFCMLSAKAVRIAKAHHRFLRTPDDAAKLISSNDTQWFTFRGRFTDGKDDSGKQACTVGYVETQKVHNVLRWLIRRQGYHKIDNEFPRCFVAWAVSCKPIPDPCANSLDFLGEDFRESITEVSQNGDIGQSFALRFQKRLAGYRASISDTEDIVLIGLGSATLGRMAITFYRKLTGSDFLDRVERWHSDFAWFQNYGRDRIDKKKIIRFQGAPAPRDIAWCAYDSKVERKNGIDLLNATVERLLPSIIDGRPVPRDLVEQCICRASNRMSFRQEKDGSRPDFEKCLGIACAMYKGSHNERGYTMALDEERNSRDYLYGRLLAVAEKLESIALYFANDKRETTAERFMQRFADRPFSTWLTIETSLTPYKSRVNSRNPGLLKGYMQLIDRICGQFQTDEFTDDSRLSGEFLLSYHCQRKWLNEHKQEKGQWVSKVDDNSEDQDSDSKN